MQIENCLLRKAKLAIFFLQKSISIFFVPEQKKKIFFYF